MKFLTWRHVFVFEKRRRLINYITDFFSRNLVLILCCKYIINAFFWRKNCCVNWYSKFFIIKIVFLKMIMCIDKFCKCQSIMLSHLSTIGHILILSILSLFYKRLDLYTWTKNPLSYTEETPKNIYSLNRIKYLGKRLDSVVF